MTHRLSQVQSGKGGVDYMSLENEKNLKFLQKDLNSCLSWQVIIDIQLSRDRERGFNLKFRNLSVSF